MSRVYPAPPPPSSSAASRAMKGNRAADTRPELAVRSAVHRLGLRFRKHARPLPAVRCKPDLIFPTERIAVFVDGCFFHRCPDHGSSPRTNSAYWRAKLDRNVSRDRENDAALAAAGWIVIRIWEHEDAEAAAHRVAAVVHERRLRPG